MMIAYLQISIITNIVLSHVIKKIRNNISKSGDFQFCKRLLKLDDKYIKWDHFKQAYMWDISANPFPIHQRLSQEHIYLSPDISVPFHFIFPINEPVNSITILL
jgi:hypothetical protein